MKTGFAIGCGGSVRAAAPDRPASRAEETVPLPTPAARATSSIGRGLRRPVGLSSPAEDSLRRPICSFGAGPLPRHPRVRQEDPAEPFASAPAGGLVRPVRSSARFASSSWEKSAVNIEETSSAWVSARLAKAGASGRGQLRMDYGPVGVARGARHESGSLEALYASLRETGKSAFGEPLARRTSPPPSAPPWLCSAAYPEYELPCRAV